MPSVVSISKLVQAAAEVLGLFCLEKKMLKGAEHLLNTSSHCQEAGLMGLPKGEADGRPMDGSCKKMGLS